MLRPPSLLGKTHSGFVPFSAGGSVHGELDSTLAPSSAGAAARAAEALPATAAVEPATWRQAAWAPAASSHVRVVEAAVLAAIGIYFSVGLAQFIGWL